MFCFCKSANFTNRCLLYWKAGIKTSRSFPNYHNSPQHWSVLPTSTSTSAHSLIATSSSWRHQRDSDRWSASTWWRHRQPTDLRPSTSRFCSAWTTKGRPFSRVPSLRWSTIWGRDVLSSELLPEEPASPSCAASRWRKPNFIFRGKLSRCWKRSATCGTELFFFVCFSLIL